MSLKLTVKSKIPDNFGQWINFEVWPEDRFSDVIKRICHVTNVQYEPKMFLRMENGEEIVTSAKVAFYMNTRQLHAPLELLTNAIAKTRWSCAFIGLFLGILGLILAIWGYYNVIQLEPSDKYTVVIDAGSSHTEFIIYQWTSAENVSTLYSTEEEIWLDYFANDLVNLGIALEIGLQKVQQNLDSNGRSLILWMRKKQILITICLRIYHIF